MNAAKDVIRTRLHLKVPPLGEASPGFMHFPADRDINYFAQILAERSTLKTNRRKVLSGVGANCRGRANEALDMRVYAYAALQGLLNAGLKLNQRVDEVSKPPRPSEMAPTVAPIAEPSPGEAPLSPVPPDPAANRRRSIVSRLA